MKKTKRKIFSLLSTLAIFATASFGALSLASCSDKNEMFGSNSGTTDVTQIEEGKTYTVSSVFGAKEVVALRTLYVSPDGTGDGTEENPMGITAALGGSAAAVQPGDVVILKDGEYKFSNTFTINKSGTYDKPITIKAENTGMATLSFYEMGGGTGLSIDADFINLIGIKECGAGSNGIRVRGNYNLVENCESFDNRDTGIQITRSGGSTIDSWPGYNLIKNCTSHNNYDYNVRGENADGFAAKLTLGYGNVFDGCIAYRNSDDGWDLYARQSQGNIGAVYIYNCVAFENGYLEYTQEENIMRYKGGSPDYAEPGKQNSYTTADGDGNGFKLGGEAMEGDVFVYNCLSFANRMHGFTDNSNPGFLSVSYCTSFNNNAAIDDDPSSPDYGKVVSGVSAIQSNFDLARSDASYNHLDHCLSVMTDMRQGLDMDYIKGSVQDSILFTDAGGASGAEAKSIKIEGSMDADVRNGITGEEIALLSADEVFEAVNAYKTTVTSDDGTGAQVTTYTHNITGCEGRESGVGGTRNINEALRNADGSINMGEYFRIKNQTALLGEDNHIGATLDKTSYDEYKHYDMTDFTDFESEIQVRLQAAKDMLYVQTDGNAVYQDFEAVSKIYGCVVTWASDNEDIIKVGKSYNTSVSESEYIPVEVYRPEADTDVTLTATIWYYGHSLTKQFTLTVKGDDPAIGDITVIGPNGAEITNGDSIIVDKYTALTEPQMTVLNAADYSGKVITEKEADFETTYEFGKDIAALNSGNSDKVSGFTTAQDGAFKITTKVTIKLGANAGQSAEFVYYVLVASNTADIGFLDDKFDISVNSGGFNVSGDLTSAIGTIYAYASSEPLSEENKTAAYIMENGQSKAFRATRISFDFANANLGAYNIYLVFTNGNGEVTSPIYESGVNVVEISTPEAFYQLAQHPMDITDEQAAKTIYALTQDLDFADFDYQIYNPAGFDALVHGFKAFFNGNGHTIRNITINSTGIQYTGVFRSLGGGTVTNVKFDNINVTGEQEKIGAIFGTIYYGNVFDVELTNITAIATGSCARVGGLTGAITSDNLPVRIYNVSIVNDTSAEEDGSYIAQIGGPQASQRVGGLVGYVQTGSADRHMDVIIHDCYVKAIVQAGNSIGGIAGNYDDRNVLDNLEITNCYTDCVLSGWGNYILGGYRGTGYHSINGCAGIVTSMSNGNVTYNSTDNSVNADNIRLAETFTALGFDLENVWVLDDVNGGIKLR